MGCFKTSQLFWGNLSMVVSVSWTTLNTMFRLHLHTLSSNEMLCSPFCRCLFAFSYSSSNNGYADPLWWFGILSPLFTMQILMTMKPTGLCNAEGKNLKRYYDKCPDSYSKYRESTSILIPMIGYKYVPMFLKRTIFFDFEKYEYKPKSESDGSAKNE